MTTVWLCKLREKNEKCNVVAAVLIINLSVCYNAINIK